MKLRQALDSHTIKRLQRMIFVGTYEHKNENYFLTRCLSPVPNVMTSVAEEKEPVFKGLYTYKGNQKLLNEQGREVLLFFRLKYTHRTFYAETVRIEPYTTDEPYQMIPIPQLQKGQEREVFERKLTNGYISFLLGRYPSDLPTPKLLLHGGRLYGNLSINATFSPFLYVEKKRQVKYVEIDDIYDWKGILVEEQLCFVTQSTYDHLIKKIEEHGSELIVNSVEEKVRTPVTPEKERMFLRTFKQIAYNRRLFFEETDFYNIHVCIKSSPITIMGGMSGIGKSQLVGAYASALGLRYGAELLWVPCSPAFQDPQDILGYLHPDGMYVASETGVVRTLLAAAKNPGQLYMIVFDEMNMSHIEHWFTSFLSLLELEASQRILTLYEPDGIERDIPPTIALGSNLIFVGTVNFDETAKDLSDRLLDRVNIIQLEKLSFRESLHMKSAKKPAEIHVSTSDFREKWTHTRDVLSVFTEAELELLDALHDALHANDPTKGISFRCVAGISFYLYNIPKDENQLTLITREEAFDLQIKQRVLTKIRGIDTAIGHLLDIKKDSALQHILRSPLAQQVSNFEHSIAYMNKKAKELELYGYVK
ncbi:AAA family ATPase [Ectobacillus antri]|jgi:hypothetical protein|uniref:AAA family ATPase n=1 Tax=Ectobacillus antri TaxID=2486280 RepID=A0ABT6H0Y2_9BACI|nr:AAA family ATPase [Ectobacillus antri]MDG4656371.1 AAA family ATPase [Ectobacillus antri]MDG5753046.1 AAA family ATPase [Ectobacillus antri]